MPSALARLKVGDLSTDGTLLSLGGERLDVPGHAAGLVRAQLLARVEQDASTADPLLARASQPFETAPLARRLDDDARLACLWRPSDERPPLWHPGSRTRARGPARSAGTELGGRGIGMIAAATADHDAVAAAIESSGLTVAEVADLLDWTPPSFTVSRSGGCLWRSCPPGRCGGRTVAPAPQPRARRLSGGLGRSLGGGRLSRRVQGRAEPNQLSHAVGWTLQRVEHALGALDAALEEVGMRLARNADRVVVVGRFERMEPAARLGLQRLTAPDLDPKLAAFIWDALGGIVPARLKDQEALEVAERLGLVVGWYGRIRVSQAVAHSLDPWTHRYYLGPGY